MRFGTLALLGCVSSACPLALGCSASSAAEGPAVSPDAGPTVDAGAGPDEGTVDADAREASSPACTARMTALQKKLNAAHGAKTNAVLEIRDPACGAMFVASGPGNVQASDLHRIGSVTKTYVTGVILGLVKDGALSLDKDVLSKWVTTIPNASSITIRQLLSHTGGVFNYTDDATWEAAVAADPTKVWAPSDLVAVAARNTPYFAPGQGWTYSNTDFILLGIIAEAVAQEKIGALVRERVLTKAMLGATFFAGEEPVTGTLAKGYDANGKDVTSYADPSYAWSAGAMVATPADVALWIEQLGGGTFYDAATQAEVVMPAPMSSQNGGSYGLGLEMLSASVTGIGPAYGHGGDIPGYHTQAFYFPQKKTTIVAIVDSDADNPNNVSLVALGVLFGP